MLWDEDTSPCHPYPGPLASHLVLKTHGRNVAPHSSILLVVAALRLHVELAVRDGFLKARAVDFVEMNWTHAFGRGEKEKVLSPARATVKKYPITLY